MGKKPSIQEPAVAFSVSGLNVGPNIVRTWFDTVLNPVIDGLRRAVPYIQKSNWTWRYMTLGFEHVRPISGYIEPDMRDNLNQLVEVFPNISEVIQQFDQAVAALMNACMKLAEEMASNSAFLSVYEESISEPVLRQAGISIDSVFGSYSQEYRRGLMIQYTINRLSVLPDYYVGHEIWNASYNRFLAVLGSNELKTSTEEMDMAGDNLLQMLEHLLDLLLRTRQGLSIEYDVPLKIA